MTAEMVFVGARLLIGGVLLLAAVGKLRDLGAFRASIRGFRVVPRGQERPLALGVVVVEIVAVLLLVVRGSAFVGLGVAAALLTAFAAGMVRVLARGDLVACGCFGRSTTPISRIHLWRNGVLVVVSIGGLAAGLVSGGAPLDAAALLVTAAFAAAAIGMLVLFDQLLAISSAGPEPTDARTPTSLSPAVLSTRTRTER
ncbi:MAG: MauE/DoxX family redox-associated membrane protein [Phycicoccus sp.]